MGLQQWIARFRSEERITATAEEIARQCLNVFWPKIASTVSDMPLSELRGYVRARTRLDIAQRVARSSVAGELAPERLIDFALHEVSQQAVARALATPQPLPQTASLPLRRAA